MQTSAPGATSQTVSQSPQHRVAFLLLPLAGLFSGLLTLWGLPYTGTLGNDPLNGLAFGLVIGACLWATRRWSLWKAVIFLIFSTAAYFLAVKAALYLPELGLVAWIRFTGKPTSGLDFYHPYRFFAGGFVGAFVLFIAIGFLLLRRKGFWRATATCLLWSVAGGLLAVLGRALGPSLGAFLFSIFQRMGHIRAGDKAVPFPLFYSTYVVWQTGMAFLMALVLWIFRRNKAIAMS